MRGAATNASTAAAAGGTVAAMVREGEAWT